MPLFKTRAPAYKPQKDLNLDWDNFSRGLNTLLKETEIDDKELVQCDNIQLIGRGVPTKRWGSYNYYMSSATGSVRGISGYYDKSGNNQLLSIADDGMLTLKSGASYSIVTGASWASGYDAYMTQLDDKTYIVNGQREMVRYSNPTLVGFPTVAQPTGAFATQISGVSGTFSPSYRVSSVTNVGETIATQYVQAGNCPQDLTQGSVKFVWTGVSAASGILQGYNIYGRNLGDERYLGAVDANTTTFIDDGSSIPKELTFPPTADSTGGINAKFVVRFEDRLIFGGISEDPSKLIISGRVPYQERTAWSYGGAWIKIEPDSGDSISGVGVFGSRIIVFKEKSIWQVTLTTESVGNYTVLIPHAQMITNSHGCVAPKSIVAVENDVMFLSRNGVYALGYEPNIAVDVLRTNELSAKIRPFFTGKTYSQKQLATATYHDAKYILSFPGTNQSIAYDRERLCWVGPWTFDANCYETYIDSTGEEHLLFGNDSSPYVEELSSAYEDDNGTAIATRLRTKKDDFGDWAAFKNIKEIFTLFRNVKGSVGVNIRIQKRDGSVTTEKSFDVQTTSASAGWGSGMWGDSQWGDSEETGGALDINEVYRYLIFNKVARNIQIEVTTTGRNDNYELLAVKANAKPLGYGILPSSEKV